MNTLLTNLLWIALALIVIAALILILRRTRLLDQAPVGLSKAFERFGAQTPAWISNWMIWNQLTPIERSFTSVNVSLRWLGIPQPVSATAASVGGIGETIAICIGLYRNRSIGTSIRTF